MTEFIFCKVAGLQLHDSFSRLLTKTGKQLLWGYHGQPWRCSTNLGDEHDTCEGIQF